MFCRNIFFIDESIELLLTINNWKVAYVDSRKKKEMISRFEIGCHK